MADSEVHYSGGLSYFLDGLLYFTTNFVFNKILIQALNMHRRVLFAAMLGAGSAAAFSPSPLAGSFNSLGRRISAAASGTVHPPSVFA